MLAIRACCERLTQLHAWNIVLATWFEAPGYVSCCSDCPRRHFGLLSRADVQARVYELEEANGGLEARADEVEGSLAAWQAEAEGAATQADARLQAQHHQHSDQQTALEASYTAKVSSLAEQMVLLMS